jgi:U2-associated protein SR140
VLSGLKKLPSASAGSRPHNEDLLNLRRSRSRSRSKDRQRSRSPAKDKRYRPSNRSHSPSWNRSRSRSRSPRRRGSYNRSRRYDDSDSRSPRWHRSGSPHYTRNNDEDEAVTDTFIRAVAAEIKGHGSKYEQNLREREQSNPKYAFLLYKGVSNFVQ